MNWAQNTIPYRFDAMYGVRCCTAVKYHSAETTFDYQSKMARSSWKNATMQRFSSILSKNHVFLLIREHDFSA
jgi:hypothetical protein